MSLGKRILAFCVGGGAYVGLELLYRRRSHWSMFLAGGSCFLLIGGLGERKLPMPARIVMGAGVITAVELLTGLMVNRKFTVWDYRSQPGNFKGQICPLFCLLWLPVSWLAIRSYDLLKKGLAR